MENFQSIRQVIAENVIRLMDGDEPTETLDKLAAKANLGRGTIDRLKKGAVSTTVGTVEAIAKVYKIQPWQLLCRDLGKSIILEPEEENLLALRRTCKSKEAQDSLDKLVLFFMENPGSLPAITNVK